MYFVDDEMQSFDKTRLPRKKGFLNSIKSRKLCDDDKSYGSSASFASPMGCLMVSEVKEKAKQTNKQLSNEFFRF